METQEPLHSKEPAWKRLQAEKQRVDDEIRNYPRPIAACDLQFNYFLEERARIAYELERMHEEQQKILTENASTRSQSAEMSRTARSR